MERAIVLREYLVFSEDYCPFHYIYFQSVLLDEYQFTLELILRYFISSKNLQSSDILFSNPILNIIFSGLYLAIIKHSYFSNCKEYII